jgi:hypothetical protein
VAVPSKAPSAYVEKLFDSYAERFDAHLQVPYRTTGRSFWGGGKAPALKRRPRYEKQVIQLRLFPIIYLVLLYPEQVALNTEVVVVVEGGPGLQDPAADGGPAREDPRREDL